MYIIDNNNTFLHDCMILVTHNRPLSISVTGVFIHVFSK